MLREETEPPKLVTWTIFKLAKQTWLGTIETTDEAEAIEKAAAEFKAPASKLLAMQRRSATTMPSSTAPPSAVEFTER